MNLILRKTKFKTQDISNMRLIVLVTFLVVSFSVFAQNKDLEKANQYFKDFNYTKAINLYKQLISEGENAYYATNQIAHAYQKMGKSQQAVNWFNKVLEYPDFDYSVYFHLSRELQKLKKYEEAAENLEEYYKRSGKKLAIQAPTLASYIQELKNDSTRYEISPLAINTRFSEFGAVIYQDKLIFSTNRPLKSITKQEDVRTGMPFFNLFEADVLSLETSGEATLFSKALQSKLNDGPICFEPDYQTIFITRNASKSSNYANELDIFVSKRKDGEWSKDIQSLPIRKSGYSVAHPCLSKDGKLLFFASNMPGGHGGMDLYVCEKKDGFLSLPINLGPEINTLGNEVFPFISTDGVLYFSSDGLPGLGGYDLFFSRNVNEQFAAPFNLGYPLNSAADDFSLTLSDDSKRGYFSSNRQGGKGEDDIYALSILKPLEYCHIKGMVTNADNSIPIEEAWVDIEDVSGMKKIRLKTDDQGQFTCFLKKDKKYLLLFRKKLFIDFKGGLIPEDMENFDELNVNIEMQEK